MRVGCIPRLPHLERGRAFARVGWMKKFLRKLWNKPRSTKLGLGHWFALGGAWLALFMLGFALLLVLVMELMPYAQLRGVTDDTGPFRVVLRRYEQLFAPDVRAALGTQARVCSLPQGDLVAEVTGKRVKVKGGGDNCDYAVGTGPGETRVVHLQCALNEFVYEVNGSCATPTERKLLEAWQMLIAVLGGALLATLGALGVRRLL